MRGLLSLRTQTLDIAFKGRILAESCSAKTWLGRSVSTRPAGCSDKCAKFEPKEPCCKKNDSASDSCLITSPEHAWNRYNIYHPLLDSVASSRDFRSPCSEQVENPPADTTREDIASCSSSSESDSCSSD